MTRLLRAADRLGHLTMSARGLESRWVEVDGVRVHVYEGRGRGHLPTIVLIHGLSAAGPSFARLVALLLPHVRRLIVPELPGHGRSSHPEADARLTPDRLLDAMTAALEKIIPTHEPAVVYGNSLGGAVALSFACRRPSLVEALVLVSPAGAPLASDEWRELTAAFDVTDRRTARRFLDRVYHRPPWFLALVTHEFPELMRRRAVRDILETTTPEHALRGDELATLAMPILLLWGKSDRLLPMEALQYFRAHLPRHAVIEEPSAFGHAPQIEHPALVAKRVLGFVREVVADSRLSNAIGRP